MPIMVEADRIPSKWAGTTALAHHHLTTGFLRVALVNNMPDAAMEDTESQYFELLENAAGPITIGVKLFSLPGVLRGERGKQRLRQYYHPIEDIYSSRFDGVIVTGTEPQQTDLRREAYWDALTQVFDWAERHTASTILSCLAAHAGVLYSDGVGRHPMWYKMCGVFECEALCDHALLKLNSLPMKFPHSRWNEVREDELTDCGYTILSRSKEAGVDCFVKRKRRSLFMHFQGHPEYEARTLFKEYRRDLRRFLAGERRNYPYVPHGYFDEAATKLLSVFRDKALADPREELMAQFPEEAVAGNLHRTWSSAATGLYGNWLQYLLQRQGEAAAFATVSRMVFRRIQSKRLVAAER